MPGSVIGVPARRRQVVARHGLADFCAGTQQPIEVVITSDTLDLLWKLNGDGAPRADRRDHAGSRRESAAAFFALIAVQLFRHLAQSRHLARAELIAGGGAES